MIAVGLCITAQACNSTKLIFALRHSRRTALFPSVSGGLCWAFIALFQVAIAIFAG